MGREIKRVPLDFNWPIDVVWGGYLNPFYKQSIKCPDCEGSGSSPVARKLKDQWYGHEPFKPEDRGSTPFTIDHPIIRRFAERNVTNSPEFYGTGEFAIVHEAKRLCTLFNKSWSHHLNDDDVAALVEANRLYDFTRTWVANGKGWLPKDPPYIPTAKEVNEWSINGMGHDGINQMVVVDAECKRLGYESMCSRCEGSGELWPTEEIQKQSEDWERTDPPAGEGYQLWETVSEGSPISLVFQTPEELAEWLMSSPNYKWKENDRGTTKEQWLKFINGPGWAMSMVIDNGIVKTGVQAI